VGVRVTTADGAVVSFRPDVATRVSPEVAADGGSVTYREVWPGVDVVYRVTPVGVKEDVVVKDRSAGSSFRFRVSGAADVRPAPDRRSAGC
jgi:hypothetical protein